MDKKAAKEEKKKQKLEKFLQKKLNTTTISKTHKPIKKPSSSGYNPLPVEAKWNDFWINNNLFKPQPKDKKFVISMPPPNVTGSLHIGHAMMVAIQDAICRYKRMAGYEVLYLPGTDHAGIATQTVVMKQLEKENKKCNREEFLEATWQWKEKYGSRIMEQFKRLGTSADLSRQRFTMDSDMNKSVTEAFCRLYEKGLIYRDNKIVNWCGKLQTTLSDIEINHVSVSPNTLIKVDGRDYEFGVIYVFKYPVRFVEGDSFVEGYLEVGTTRPETILGDVALCANPNDKRYTKYKKIIPINPLTGKELDFVFDEGADMELESGVLKITPAHDPVDFDIGKKHKLPQIVIFDSENKILCENEYKGLSRLDARDRAIEKLKEKNLFIGKKPHEQILPFCSRSNDLIEPIIKEQWWCNCTNMAKKAIDIVKNNKIEIHPAESKEDWYRWFENPRDWCLSRQLWWGHRIPAYKSPSNEWSIGRTKREAIESFYKNNSNSKIYLEADWEQDEDVLDTWFSSGLWPFATLGWPEKTPDFDDYFPTSLLETGKDILFFWVGRMVMLSLELTESVPFKNILLHGIVRDANGRKMSKSLGNVIDPIHVIDGSSLENLLEVARSGNLSNDKLKASESVIRNDFPNGIDACGADALRFTLLSYVNGINDIKLDIERVKGNRKFCNKIWNASIFVKKIVDEFINDNKQEFKNNKEYENLLDGLEDKLKNESDDLLVWLIQKRDRMISSTKTGFKEYNFMSATQSIHQFFLYDFCDVYIEIVKKVKNDFFTRVIFFILIDCLKVFSSYMPFISEEIYSKFFNKSLLNAEFPKEINNKNPTKFRAVLNKVKSLRADIEKSKRNKISVIVGTDEDIKESDLRYIKSLISNIQDIKMGDKSEIIDFN
jgi:valyl-tRNA synthetase